MLNKAHSQGHSSDESDTHPSAILGKGGVVQVGDINLNLNNSAHVEVNEVAQVGDIFLQANSQVQREGLRKVIVQRGVKRKRS